jgi:hypothetical protein
MLDDKIAVPDLSPTLLVVGNEVEAVVTAVSAALQAQSTGLPLKVNLALPAPPPLGGLCSHLAYLDRTVGLEPPLYRKLLLESGVQRVSMDPQRLHTVLQRWLADHHISVFPIQLPLTWQGQALEDASGQRLAFDFCLDATPDADVGRAAGLPVAVAGFKTVLPSMATASFLGVSPVFQVAGLWPEALIAFEARLRASPEMPAWLDAALPELAPESRAALLTRPCFPGPDYLDMLNPALGVAYHVWRHGQAASYPEAMVWIDGGNIALLDAPPEDSPQSMAAPSPPRLSWNGMVARGEHLDGLLAWSHGEAPVPEFLQQELQHFQRFLHEAGGLTQARVLAPRALYVRQTLQLRMRQMMTARNMLEGGVATDLAIGTASYWLDTRGISLRRYFPGLDLPKPVYNLGLEVALPPTPGPLAWQRLGVLGRSAGYAPLAQGAGRIVQHNCLLGEALGMAAAMALTTGEEMGRVPRAEIRAQLAARHIAWFGEAPLPVYGQRTLPEGPLPPPLAALLARDEAAIQWQGDSPA